MCVLAYCFATAASADLIPYGSFGVNVADGGFGPFYTDEAITILVTLENRSPNQTLTICPGICVGGPNTFSLGAVTGVPNGYSFFYGNAEGGGPDSFDGQAVGALSPGEVLEFVFGVYVPGPDVVPGWYSFGLQLQVFAATVERPLLGAPGFGGRWEVVQRSVDEPATILLVFIAVLAIVPLTRQRVGRRLIAFRMPCSRAQQPYSRSNP